MAASSSCRSEILSVGGVQFLLGLLEEAKGNEESSEQSSEASEVAAAERVMKKAAIALSREH